MSKNVLLCALGIILGFAVGFFITNAVTKPVASVASTRPASSNGTAGPLKPEEMGGALPPGHPAVDDGAQSDAPASAASTAPEAQAAMDKADRNPKDFQAQATAAQVFYGLHDYQKATLYLDRALAIKGNDFDALVLMGNTKYDDKDFSGAATFYERALAAKPDSPDVRTDLGNTFFNRGDYDRAIAEYRKSVAHDPNHLNSWRNIAAAALQKGDKATASEAIEQLARIAPQSEETESFRQKLARMP
ncbi:MAG: hypothetical protein QOH51_356 [Acidobacteriota bacterium]|jgi:tetratricopeptide (TPR) repeat protein|nr:hypothetical protein [Acidobacteriota bacterium]